MTRTTIRLVPYFLTLLAFAGCNGDHLAVPAASEMQLAAAGTRHSQYWCSECADMVNDGKGINLFAALDWASDQLFADAVKTSIIRGVGPDGWIDLDSQPPADADGWPLTDAGFFLFPGGQFTQTTGSYSLSFTGQATIGGTFTIQNQTFDGTTTRATAVRGSDSGDAILIFTGTTAGVKNLKVMKPGYTTADTFTTPIKNLIRRFRAIRAMDLTATNWNQSVSWSDRVLPTFATQQTGEEQNGYGWEGRGVAWEYVAQLANETGVNLWIDIPARANDDYVQHLALLMRDGANGFAAYHAGGRIYVEYSNEVWNFGSFSQGQESQDLAVAEVNAGNSPLNYDNANDIWTWTFRRTAKRALEISKIFCDTFAAVYGTVYAYGDPVWERRNRNIRPVFAWQQTNGQDTGRLGLNFIDNYYNNGDGNHVSDPHPPSYWFYGGAGSAYYNPDNNDTALNLDNIWTSQTMVTTAFASAIQQDVDLAVAYGLRRVAYEGGPGLDNADQSVVSEADAQRIDAVKAQAWADPRMTTAVTDHDQQWYYSGGDLLMYFQSTGDAQWGFTHDVNVLDTPKLNGVANSPSPRFASLLTYGPLVPASTTTPLDLDTGAPSAFNSWDAQPGSMQAGHWFSYTFRTHLGTATDMPYRVSATFTSDPGSQIELIVDGVSRGTFTTTGTGSPETMHVDDLMLFDDLHAFAVRCRGGSFSLQQLQVLALATQ